MGYLKRMLLVAAGLFFVLAPWASGSEFTGSWRGSQGQVQLFIDGEDQGSAPCRKFVFDIVQTEFEFKFVKAYWHCGHHLVYDVLDRTYEIRGEGELWLWGKPAGWIRPGLVELVPGAGEGERSAASIELRISESDRLDLRHTWSDGFSKFIVRGDLTR